MKLLAWIPGWCKSKYLLSGLAFIVWMFFFDRNDVFTQFERIKMSKQTKHIELLKTKEIADTRIELNLLKTNAQTIERYARENYMMKKDNEDLFLVNLPAENN